MILTGLHLLLTYQCNFECDHCFVWSGPHQSGTMTSDKIRDILNQAQELGGIEWIYFEGGEPFLYYPILLKGVQEANEMGFKVGLVSNGYWAQTVEDALEWLRPMAGLVQDLSVSSDLFHYGEKVSQQSRCATLAAELLGIPLGVICIAPPNAEGIEPASGQLPEDESGVMFRGRAATKLADNVAHRPWTEFTDCPYENLRDPGRVHVDPLGHVHICQGISLGNLFETPLKEICIDYDPDSHPIVGPLLRGGPAELSQHYHTERQPAYADACHMCDAVRRLLRVNFPDALTPDHIYGNI